MRKASARAQSSEQARSNGDKDRRAEILAVAAELFARKGFHGTSMDDIAQKMGMLKGSLYYWIKSKEELLYGILAEGIVQTIADAEEIAAREIDAGEKLRLLIASHIESWIRNPNNFNVFLYEYRFLGREDRRVLAAHNEPVEAIYKQVLREGIETGVFDLDERDVTIAMNSIFGMMNWFPRWYRPHRWATPDYIAERMADMVIEGLKAR